MGYGLPINSMVDLSRWYGFTVLHSMVDLSSSQTLNVITRWDMVYLLIAWWIFLDGMGLPFFIAWWIFPVRKPGPVKDQLVGGSLRRISVSAT